MATTAERLLARLREELRRTSLDLPEGTVLNRTNASASQRNGGAWSWSVWHDEIGYLGPGQRDLGSHYPMKVLLGCRDWTFDVTTFAMNVDPCDECIAKHGRVRF